MRQSHGLLNAGMLLACIALLSNGCAAWPFRRPPINEFAPPRVFSEQPSLDNLIARINNSLRIQRLESNFLTITNEKVFAKLRGNMQWERPDKFTMQAHMGTRALGVQLAAGSNPDMFWLQMSSPPAIYFARHDEFINYRGPRYVLPVSPLWFREALGVIEFSDQWKTEEPIVRADGKVELRTYIPESVDSGRTGRYFQRHLVIDPATAVIEETRLYNPVEKLVAVARQSEHSHYASIDYNLPHKVDIHLYPDIYPDSSNELSFSIEVGRNYTINGEGSAVDAFKPPDTTGVTMVNLVQPEAPQSADLTQLPITTPPTYTAAAPYARPGAFSNMRR